jgi:uncharacterized protein involved in type VI secretion and phage assembly
MNGQYFGKYRGKVVNNTDTHHMGRIQIKVPTILGDNHLNWAMPCVPYAGPGVGFYMVPPVDANVWIEFEGGDPNYPIWSGCFWEEGDVPADPDIPQMKVLKTDSVTITLNDKTGESGVSIEYKPGENDTVMKIVINSQGIEINDGKKGVIKLAGKQVSINDGALEVT